MIGTSKTKTLQRRTMRNRFQLMDTILLAILLLWTLVIILPFINVLAASFSTPKEYMDSPLMLFPANPTLENYKTLFQDGRIWTGYRTTLTILVLGVPLNMFLSTSVAYALSRPAYPLQKFFLYAILFTMLFNGGIVPLYLLMLELKLTNKIWSVILAYGVNNFYMIIMRSYFLTIPDSLLESARLDGANEWRILAQIVLPLSMPIIATMILFYSVDRWNEWFNAMIFIRKNNMIPLQLVLRNMVLEASAEKTMMASHSAMAQSTFSTGIKMGAVIVTIAPIMCVFPFLQRYFVKGIMIGAIKA